MELGSIWNSTDSEIDVLAHKIDVLTRHCDSVGREFAGIRKTVGFFDDPFTDVDGYIRKVERMAGLGVGSRRLRQALRRRGDAEAVRDRLSR